MMRIVRRPAPAAATAAGRAIAGEPGAGLAGQLAAGVVLGDQLHVAILGPAVSVSYSMRRSGSSRWSSTTVRSCASAKARRSARRSTPSSPVLAIEELLVIPFEFVVEDHAGDAAAFALDLSRLLQKEAIQSGRRAGVRAASRHRRSPPAGGHPGGSTSGRRAGPSPRGSARRRVGRRRNQ